jgi:hypothetical protein
MILHDRCDDGWRREPALRQKAAISLKRRRDNLLELTGESPQTNRVPSSDGVLECVSCACPHEERKGMERNQRSVDGICRRRKTLASWEKKKACL